MKMKFLILPISLAAWGAILAVVVCLLRGTGLNSSTVFITTAAGAALGIILSIKDPELVERLRRSLGDRQ